jgi:hypothetical protein
LDRETAVAGSDDVEDEGDDDGEAEEKDEDVEVGEA